MASPQVEDGYTRIANELLEALIKSRLSGQELSVALFIMRKTYGYGQKEVSLSYSEIAEAVDSKRQNIARIIRKLSSKWITAVIKLDDRKKQVFKINKNYEQWEVRAKKDTGINFDDRTVIQLDAHTPIIKKKKEILAHTFLLKDGSEYKIDDDFQSLLKETYPSINTDKELKKIRAWCVSNPSQRKTKRGAKKFVNGWFSRADSKAVKQNQTPEWL